MSVVVWATIRGADSQPWGRYSMQVLIPRQCVLFACFIAAAATPEMGVNADSGRQGEQTELTGNIKTLQSQVAARVSIYDATLSDTFVAGGEVDVRRTTADDLYIAGGSVRLTQVTGEDLVAAAGELTLQAEIDDDVIAAGGRIRLDSRTVVRGDVVAAGGDVEIAGQIDGNVTVAGARVLIAGVVGGDVQIAAGEVIVGSSARITGTLVYRSGEAAQIAPGAVVSGEVRHLVTQLPASSSWAIAGIGLGVLLVGITALVVLALGLHGVLPKAVGDAISRLRQAPGMSWLLGFGLLVAVPVAANLLLVSFVGSALALVVYAMYGLGLALATVTSAAWLGYAITGAARTTPGDLTLGSSLTRTALGAIVLAVLGLIPVLGWLALFALIPAAAGAVATVSWQLAQSQQIGRVST